MLALKWVASDGSEVVQMVDKVMSARHDDRTDKVIGYRGDVCAVIHTSGRVYVMNDQGNTISAYDMRQGSSAR